MALAAGHRGADALKFGVGRRHVPTIGRDHRVHEPSRHVHRLPSDPKRRYRLMTIEVFGDSKAKRERAVPKQTIEHDDIVGDQRAFVKHERLRDFGDNFRNVDLEHHGDSCDLTSGEESAPSASPATATRSTRSSRQGAATICTPSGNPSTPAIGAATTGSPANEIGWV